MRLLFLLSLLAGPLPAATIGASETSVLLHTGDSLVFELLTRSFTFYADRYGLDRYPTEVSFTLVSAAVPDGAQLSASLESPDGGASAAFHGSTYFSEGWIYSSQHFGEVATLDGYLRLTGSESADLFGAGFADLVFTNIGPDLQLGLPPFPLRRDLNVTLSSGPLGVGAVISSVSLREAIDGPDSSGFPGLSATVFAAPLADAVPEPGTMVPVLVALAILGLIVRFRRDAAAQTANFTPNFPSRKDRK